MYAPLQTGSKDLRSECMTILKVVCAAAAVRAAPSAAAMVASTSTNLRPMRWQTVMIASPLERCHGSAGGRPTPSCQAEFVRQDAAGYRLLSPYPTPGGTEQIEGIGGQVRAWAALHARSVVSRFEAPQTSSLTTLVGREEESEIMLRRWSRAKGGDGQVLLL